MGRVLLLVLVASCWRGGGPAVKVSVMHIQAARPPITRPDGCGLAIEDLGKVVNGPAVGSPRIDGPCDDPDTNYWWCMFDERSRTLETLSDAAHWAVYYCQPEQ